MLCHVKAEPLEATSSTTSALVSRTTARSELSTRCTECCGNVDYSTFANCGIFRFGTPCGVSPEAIHSLLRRARRGSRTKQHRKAVRGGSQEPKRKVSRSCGRNRDRLGDFFWSAPWCGAAASGASRIAAMHPPRPPSIDQGVIAVIWAVGLGIYIYFGLLAVGASGATAIVISLVSFAGIWLLVRLRGEEPVRRPRRRRS